VFGSVCVINTGLSADCRGAFDDGIAADWRRHQPPVARHSQKHAPKLRAVRHSTGSNDIPCSPYRFVVTFGKPRTRDHEFFREVLCGTLNKATAR